MYVLKVGSMYFTGSGLSDSQRDAKRFTSSSSSLPTGWLVEMFGPDSRFVRLRPRA